MISLFCSGIVLWFYFLYLLFNINQVFLCRYYVAYVKHFTVLAVSFKLTPTYFDCTGKPCTCTLTFPRGRVCGPGRGFSVPRAVPPWRTGDIGKVKPLFLPSSKLPLSEILLSLGFWNLPGALLSAYKGTLICSWLWKLVYQSGPGGWKPLFLHPVASLTGQGSNQILHTLPNICNI